MKHRIITFRTLKKNCIHCECIGNTYLCSNEAHKIPFDFSSCNERLCPVMRGLPLAVKTPRHRPLRQCGYCRHGEGYGTIGAVLCGKNKDRGVRTIKNSQETCPKWRGR